VSQEIEYATEPEGPETDPTRRYIIIAAILLAVILVVLILLVVFGLPALQGEDATATLAPTATLTPVPTPTSSATPEPEAQATATLIPSPVPTEAGLVMQDTDEPLYEFQSAGARPGVEWTGFFGQVLDATGDPAPDVLVIVWYPEGQPAIDPVRTDGDGYYEIRLAEAPFAGTWTIQLLTGDYQPASKLFTFQTDEDTTEGVQQIQVLWQEATP
jgi:hypothetical protein